MITMRDGDPETQTTFFKSLTLARLGPAELDTCFL
jgi:hypothetical protein